MSSCKKGSQGPKCHNRDNIDIAVEAINSAMRRNGLGLGDMYHALNRLIDMAVAETIARMRAEGRSIREIARTVHMDDKRVSKLIKAAQMAADITRSQIREGSFAGKLPPAKTATKPCKSCKSCKK